MALPSSGQLSLADIAGEFGGTAPHSLSEYYGAASGIPTSGQISISDFYGASAVSATFEDFYTEGLQSFANSRLWSATMDIGAPSADRIVAVAVSWRSSGQARTIDSASIGGVPATVAVISDPRQFRVAIIYASVPTGTTALVEVNFNRRLNAIVMGAYRLVGFSGIKETAVISLESSVTVNPNNGNFVIACSAESVGELSITGGVTEDYSAPPGFWFVYFVGGSVVAQSSGALDVTFSTNVNAAVVVFE